MITAMLFFLVGVVYDRAHHRQIDGFGGLGVVVPVYTAFIGFAFFASLGFPDCRASSPSRWSSWVPSRCSGRW